MIYAATHVAKEVFDTRPEAGLVTSGQCTLDQNINVTAVSVSGLIKRLTDGYALPGPPEPVTDSDYILFEATENESGFPATDREMASWLKGNTRLWLARYYFSVERRMAEPISAEEFRGAGLTV